jgi:hypothetical protein
MRRVPFIVLIVLAVYWIIGCQSRVDRFVPLGGLELFTVLDTKTGVVWMMRPGEVEKVARNIANGREPSGRAGWYQMTEPVPKER